MELGQTCFLIIWAVFGAEVDNLTVDEALSQCWSVKTENNDDVPSFYFGLLKKY